MSPQAGRLSPMSLAYGSFNTRGNLRVRHFQLRCPQDQLGARNSPSSNQRSKIDFRFQQLHEVDKPPVIWIASMRSCGQQQHSISVFPQGFRKLVILRLIRFLG